jgi:hypothetical protein
MDQFLLTETEQALVAANKRIMELELAGRELLIQIDDGPRDCFGTRQDGKDVWKGSFLSRIERLRALLPRIDRDDD